LLVATTLWVDPNIAASGNVFSTIGDAVAAAHSGDTVKVVAGTYDESVTVDKTLSIIGGQVRDPNEPRGPAIIEGPTIGFSIKANGVAIQNFTVQNVTTGIETSDGVVGYKLLNNRLVDNLYGVLLGEVNDITARASMISGNEFDHVSAFQFSDIDFLGAAQNVTVSHNTFQAHSSSSIFGPTQSNNIQILNNRFFGDGGIFITDTTNLRIDYNTIIDPSSTAIALGSIGSLPSNARSDRSEIVGNKLIHFSGPAVYGIDWGHGTFFAPSIRRIAANSIDGFQYGIILRSLEQATVSGNSVINSAADGIFAGDCRAITISSNSLFKNANYGIDIRSSTGKVLSKNTADSNSLDGIFLFQSTGFTVSSNTAINNGASGLEIAGNANDTTEEWNVVSKNIFSGNSLSGITLINTSGNALTANTAKLNGFGASGASSGSGNVGGVGGGGGTSGGGGGGIVLGDGSGISLSGADQNKLLGNVVSANSFFGIVLDGSSRNLVSGNTVNATAGNGINLLENATSNRFALNTVSRSLGSGFVTGLTSSNNTFTNNILRNNASGFTINSNGNSLISNVISGGYPFGMYIYGNSNVVKSNIVTGIDGVGIQLFGQMDIVSGNIIKNTHSTPEAIPGDNLGDGIRLLQVSNSTISGNLVISNEGDGIQLDANCFGNTVSNNTAIGDGALGGFDLLDDSTGSGTAGTANAWLNNKAATRSPSGLP